MLHLLLGIETVRGVMTPLPLLLGLLERWEAFGGLLVGAASGRGWWWKITSRRT
jgi:hypothetical protein